MARQESNFNWDFDYSGRYEDGTSSEFYDYFYNCDYVDVSWTIGETNTMWAPGPSTDGEVATQDDWLDTHLWINKLTKTK